MHYLGIKYAMKHPPILDPEFIPFGVWIESYLTNAQKADCDCHRTREPPSVCAQHVYYR